MDFDTTVKLSIFDTLARTTHVPTALDVARTLKAPLVDVEDAFRRLHERRLLVPEPDDRSRIRMAPPFSGIPTAFRVTVQNRTYYANCAWDALGIPAALHRDAVVEASDAHTGEPVTLRVLDAQPLPERCVFHFAVPAARWWDDIIYT